MSNNIKASYISEAQEKQIALENKFWNIIDESYSTDKDTQLINVKNILKTYWFNDLLDFQILFSKYVNELYTSEYWCAADIFSYWCSDDSFFDFRYWVIFQWRIFYESFKKDTEYTLYSSMKFSIENLKSYFNYNRLPWGNDFFMFESFWYVIMEVFEEKFWKNIYDYISDDSDYIKLNLDWSWNNELMEKMYPKLYKLAGEYINLTSIIKDNLDIISTKISEYNEKRKFL